MTVLSVNNFTAGLVVRNSCRLGTLKIIVSFSYINGLSQCACAALDLWTLFGGSSVELEQGESMSKCGTEERSNGRPLYVVANV